MSFVKDRFCRARCRLLRTIQELNLVICRTQRRRSVSPLNLRTRLCSVEVFAHVYVPQGTQNLCCGSIPFLKLIAKNHFDARCYKTFFLRNIHAVVINFTPGSRFTDLLSFEGSILIENVLKKQNFDRISLFCL